MSVIRSELCGFVMLGRTTESALAENDELKITLAANRKKKFFKFHHEGYLKYNY